MMLPGLPGGPQPSAEAPLQAAGQEEHEKIFLLVLELTNPDQVPSAKQTHPRSAAKYVPFVSLRCGA